MRQIRTQSFAFGFEYLGKINFLVEAILGYESGEKVLDKKTRSRKSNTRVPVSSLKKN
jgi:hypothetical protein